MNLQIVNGGQTTASIYQAVKKDKADISNIYVQAKLSVVVPEKVNEIVPLISRYANNQNKVSEADFSANDSFHIKIEELSRTIWAPAVDGTQRQTRWFYERARGQYLDAKGREKTLAKKAAFTSMHPTSQKFTKTDLAKFENTWQQLPHLVSLGAEKNFRELTIKLANRGKFQPDEDYFKRLVAKAIL
ncbi:MAG: AIPR family protein [Stigonema ocellatum SAG 48.90 = DSM 106950]|nr:AIPR family protein [Stigonema ocellatum SAG 48.90 = DSM 106950]